jgi:hypothetical protein
LRPFKRGAAKLMVRMAEPRDKAWVSGPIKLMGRVLDRIVVVSAS